ncbi:MAG: hypothetical protein J6A52_03205 [Bacilli bacterium]|nr:hypothetical protein [Bacilli bacterium]
MKILTKFKGLTNRGFGKVEVMVMLCALLVLLAFGVKSLSDNQDSSNISMLKRQADNFAYKVGIYKDMYIRDDNIYYLDYLLDASYAIELTSPTDSNVKCNRYESYVKITNASKQVTLKCGNYLAVGYEGGNYSIYELSEWMNDAPNDSISGEIKILYNYTKDGKEMSNSYMLENEFIDFYNSKEGTSVSSLSEIVGDGIEVISKGLYREKTFLKEI